MPSQTNEQTINGITYQLNGNEAVVRKVDPSAIQNNTLIIPEKIKIADKEYPVTTLDTNAICNEINGPEKDNFKDLEAIFFEGSITLKDHAISNCYNLKFLGFYAEVKSVKASAIYFLREHPLQNVISIVGGRSTRRTFVDINEIIKNNVICYNDNTSDQIKIDFKDMTKKNENFYYVEDGDKIIIKRIKNKSKVVTIPEEIEGKKVTVQSHIAASSRNSLLEEIIFPKTIDKIPAYTLYMCANLKKVTITNPNCDIDNEFINLYNNNQHIELIAPIGSKAQTFAENNQSNFEFKELAPSISNQTKETDDFEYIETANNVTITQIKRLDNDSKIIIPKKIEGKDVVNIDSAAFGKVRDKVKSVDIKSNIESIEKELFKNCKELAKVTLPNTIKKISDYAFSGTKKLNSLTIPNTIQTIANNAFEGCKINLISESQLVNNYVNNLGASNVTFQNLQDLLNSEWQYFENITPTYQLDVTTDLDSIAQKLSSLKTSIQDNTKKQIIDNLLPKINYEGNNNPPTNDIKYIAFSIPEDEKIYKIAVAAANYDGIKNLIDQLKSNNIVCEPKVKAYRQDKNQGPEQYERYLYEFNKTINGADQAKNDLNHKSPLEHTRNPYSFESNQDEYYNPIYVNRYRKSKENPVKVKKLFGKIRNIGNLNDPEHQGLFKNLKKYARLLNHMAGDSLNKLNENNKDARSAHLSIKLLLSKPFKIVVLTAAIVFAGTTLLPILANFAFSAGMIPGIIASGGLANPAVQHSLFAALYTGIAAIGTGFMAYMVRHLNKKKEQKLAQQEQRTDTTGTPSEGQQEQRTDTAGTSSEGQQEETQEVGTPMTEEEVLKRINTEFGILKKIKQDYEEAKNLLENNSNENVSLNSELESTYKDKKELFVNLLLDYYTNYPVKFEGGSLTR